MSRHGWRLSAERWARCSGASAKGQRRVVPVGVDGMSDQSLGANYAQRAPRVQPTLPWPAIACKVHARFGRGRSQTVQRVLVTACRMCSTLRSSSRHGREACCYHPCRRSRGRSGRAAHLLRGASKQAPARLSLHSIPVNVESAWLISSHPRRMDSVRSSLSCSVSSASATSVYSTLMRMHE